MELKVEIVAAIFGALAILCTGIKWAFGAYADSRVKESVEDVELQSLRKRVESLELDVKEMAIANTRLSSEFNSEINKILHRLAGGTDE